MAHAFMHSPIPPKECIVLQLPQSVSLEDGSLAYLVLYRALNGLRDASLAWLNLLSASIKSVGLLTDDIWSRVSIKVASGGVDPMLVLRC